MTASRAIYAVRKLYYAVHDFDRIMCRRGPMVQEPLGWESYKLGGKELAWEVACLTARIAGLAVVWEGELVHAVGTLTSLSFWEWGRYRPYQVAKAEALDSLDEPDPRMRQLCQFRSDRIQRDRIRHRVVQDYPAFRVWPADPDYTHGSPEEVQLRTEAGGLRLGGVVLN